MQVSNYIRQGFEFAVANHLAGIAANAPPDIQKRVRERCVAKVDSIVPKSRERSLKTVADLLGKEFSHQRAVETPDKLTVRFDNELFAVPDGWADKCQSAKEIELVFGNALGGSTEAAFKMVEAMKVSGAVTTGTVIGSALSAHALLWLGCDHRTMRPDSTLLIHGPIQSVIGTPDRIRKELRDLDHAEEKHIDFITARTGLDRCVIERWIWDGDIWLTADECAALGLAGSSRNPAPIADSLP